MKVLTESETSQQVKKNFGYSIKMMAMWARDAIL
jgi:hypothetical protein